MTEYLFKKDITQGVWSFKKINQSLYKAWMDYHNSVFADGALSRKDKELTSVKKLQQKRRRMVKLSVLLCPIVH